MTTFLLVLHFMVCFVLIAVVLLQRGKGASLGAALGGGGGNTLFGSRGPGNFLTRLTTASAIIFMLTSLSLAYFTTQSSDVTLFEGDESAEQSAPGAASPADAGAPPAGDAAPSGALREIEVPAASPPEPAPAEPTP